MNPPPLLSWGFPSWQLRGTRAHSLPAVRPSPVTPTGRGHGDFSPSPGLRPSSRPSSEEKRPGLNALGPPRAAQARDAPRSREE